MMPCGFHMLAVCLPNPHELIHVTEKNSHEWPGSPSFPKADSAFSAVTDGCKFPGVPHGSCTFLRLLTVRLCQLPLPIVLDEAGSCDLRGLSLLPALEVIQPLLASSKQGSLQFVQSSHQHGRVFIVGVLGGVHDTAEAADEGLQRTSTVTDG